MNLGESSAANSLESSMASFRMTFMGVSVWLSS